MGIFYKTPTGYFENKRSSNLGADPELIILQDFIKTYNNKVLEQHGASLQTRFVLNLDKYCIS